MHSIFGTNYHEAGHAIMALALDVGVTHVINVMNAEGCETLCGPEFIQAIKSGQAPPDLARRGMLVTIAGPLYENMAARNRNLRPDEFGGRNKGSLDAILFWRCADLAGESVTDLAFEGWVSQALRIFDANSKAAKALAKALWDAPAGKMPGSEVHRIWEENGGVICPVY
jgi:hypothetical protein